MKSYFKAVAMLCAVTLAVPAVLTTGCSSSKKARGGVSKPGPGSKPSSKPDAGAKADAGPKADGGTGGTRLGALSLENRRLGRGIGGACPDPDVQAWCEDERHVMYCDGEGVHRLDCSQWVNKVCAEDLHEQIVDCYEVEETE